MTTSAPAGANAPARIGLYGGSFDPPHCAHLALAHAALAQLALDELRWLPAGQPWQKGHSLAPAEDRLAMLRLLTAGVPRFVLDAQELQRSGPSFTVDTVEALRAEHPSAELLLVIGQDQYAGLPSWHRADALMERVTLAVAAREGREIEAPQAWSGRTHRLRRIELPAMAVSSSAIRARLAAGVAACSLVPAMVPAEVARYIDSKGLYCLPAEARPQPGAPDRVPPRS